MTETAPVQIRRVWCIPGMGADRRLFAGLGLGGSVSCGELLYADWIPARAHEDLTAYAERFAQHYGIGSADILVGVSMGGMVAAAIVQRRPACRLILVSSGNSLSQLVPLARWLGPVARVIPFGLVRWLPVCLVPARLRVPVVMFVAQDPAFIRWACAALLRWPGVPRPAGTFTIHGSADPVFPLARQPQVDVIIPGGGHLMILDHAQEVSAALRAGLEGMS